MKKTVTANISGIVFHIDEDAYEKLGRYLANVKSHFNTDAGADEILADIESRIAEMFQEKITASKKVISIDDVNEVISQLGEPEQMAEPEEEPKSKGPKFEERAQKRLYRDPDDKYIAGVSGGLGAFFNLDPVWIRVAFVVFTFAYGFGPLLYIILWIVVPKAKTTAERLEMRGERVNISNIEKSIKEELNELKDNIKEFSEETKQHFKKKGKSSVDKNNSARVAAGFINVLTKAAGVILIFIAFSFALTIISGFWFMPFGFHFTHGMFHFSFADFFTPIFSSLYWTNASAIAIAVLLGIPIFWILFAGIQLLFDIKSPSKYLGIITLILWLAAIATLGLATARGVKNFSSYAEGSSTYVLASNQWPSLYIQLDDDKMENEAIYWKTIRFGGRSIGWQETHDRGFGKPELTIKESLNNDMVLQITKSSRGADPRDAGKHISNIEYSFIQKDSLLILDPVFYFDKDAGWRNQKVKLELFIPEGKIVIPDTEVQNYLQVQIRNNVKTAN